MSSSTDILTNVAELDNLTDLLVNDFCRNIVSSNGPKLAIMCSIVNQFDLVFRRDRTHILLYGKPGCGKSGLLGHLEEYYGAAMTTGDAKESSLKGHGGMKGGGAKLLAKQDLGIVCMDDIEKVSAVDDMRDVMERGGYKLVKGGKDEWHNARCTIVGACNDMSKMSPAIMSRFDLVYEYRTPSPSEMTKITNAILFREDEAEDVIKNYLLAAQLWKPDFSLDSKEEVSAYFNEYYTKYPSDKYSGRWFQSVRRIAVAHAKLGLTDLTLDHFIRALEMKNQSDEIVEEWLVWH